MGTAIVRIGSDNLFLPLEVWFLSDYTMQPVLIDFQIQYWKFQVGSHMLDEVRLCSVSEH